MRFPFPSGYGSRQPESLRGETSTSMRRKLWARLRRPKAFRPPVTICGTGYVTTPPIPCNGGGLSHFNPTSGLQYSFFVLTGTTHSNQFGFENPLSLTFLQYAVYEDCQPLVKCLWYCCLGCIYGKIVFISFKSKCQ